MWFHRWMLKISWIQEVSNVKVLEMTKTERMLKKWIMDRKIKYCGHIVKGEKYEILTYITRKNRGIEEFWTETTRLDPECKEYMI